MSSATAIIKHSMATRNVEESDVATVPSPCKGNTLTTTYSGPRTVDHLKQDTASLEVKWDELKLRTDRLHADLESVHAEWQLQTDASLKRQQGLEATLSITQIELAASQQMVTELQERINEQNFEMSVLQQCNNAYSGLIEREILSHKASLKACNEFNIMSSQSSDKRVRANSDEGTEGKELVNVPPSLVDQTTVSSKRKRVESEDDIEGEQPSQRKRTDPEDLEAATQESPASNGTVISGMNKVKLTTYDLRAQDFLDQLSPSYTLSSYHTRVSNPRPATAIGVTSPSVGALTFGLPSGPVTPRRELNANRRGSTNQLEVASKDTTDEANLFPSPQHGSTSYVTIHSPGMVKPVIKKWQHSMLKKG